MQTTNLSVARMKSSVFETIENIVGKGEKNIVGKGENAGSQHFLLFSTMFYKAVYFRVFKSSQTVW